MTKKAIVTFQNKETLLKELVNKGAEEFQLELGFEEFYNDYLENGVNRGVKPFKWITELKEKIVFNIECCDDYNEETDTMTKEWFNLEI